MCRREQLVVDASEYFRLKRLDENVKLAINTLQTFLANSNRYRPSFEIAEEKLEYLKGLYKENPPDLKLL